MQLLLELITVLQVKTLAADRVSSWSVKREHFYAGTESAKSLTEQALIQRWLKSCGEQLLFLLE